MRDFPTLAHTIQFVYDRKPELKKGAKKEESKPETAAPVEQPAVGAASASSLIRRVPAPQLRPPLNLCKPTGIELQSGVRVVVMTDQGGVGKALMAKLEKLGVQPLVIDGTPDAKFLAKKLESWIAEGPIQGVFWLPALDAEGPIAELSYAQWREATRIRAKLLFTTMQALYDQGGEQGVFLVSATRLGGVHGYEQSGAADPLGGAVSGFTKAYKREKDKAVVKVVDFEPSRKTSALADLLIDEALRDPGVVEIGYKDGQRWTIGLQEKPIEEVAGLKLGKDTVFVITGAAGSIVSAITADLAAASGGIFYLLDLTPEPDPNNSDLQKLISDKEGLKRDIFERLKSRGERATPAMVDKELAGLERSRAALDAMLAVKKAGGTPHYFSLDLMDNAAVSRAIKTVIEQQGRVDVLMHAAGLEISRKMTDKKPAEFDLIFDVKSDGWFNLISSIGKAPLGAAVVFSSVAGRFGNSGQPDYSAANDLLCKCMSNLRSVNPKAKGIAIDWTAWSGIGMAARGSIPVIMKQAGIDMLPPEAGIPVVRRELTSGASSEVVIGQKLGILMQEFDPQGGLDASMGGPVESLARQRGVMIGEIKGMGLYSGLTVETTLDPVKQPFLFDHQIEGVPVLPGVMGMEAMAEAAKLLFPERHVGAMENVSFLTPFKFYRNQPRTVTVHVQFSAEKEDIVADCKLIGSRTLHGQTAPEITTHFSARVRLVSKEPKPISGDAPDLNVKNNVGASEIYKIYFHGPAYQVIQEAWRSGDEIIAQFAKNLPENHDPSNLPVAVSPRLIELCFQTASLSGLALESKLGLPFGLREFQICSFAGVKDEELFALIKVNSDGTYDCRLSDAKGSVYMVLSGYKTIDLPGSAREDLVKPLQQALKK
jgi:NAD(P)-dependent dehydrogenase (short-subunit alcohol dehydrogenase family)